MLEPWQHGPPARGGTYDRYDLSYRNARDAPGSAPPDETGANNPKDDRSTPQVDETVRVVLEHTSHLPVRVTVLDQNNNVLSRSYFDYDVERTETAEHSSDFFRVGAPADSGYRREVSQRGAGSAGTVSDRQTGSTFTPWSLGRSVQGPGQRLLCQRDNDVVNERDSTASDNEIAPGQQDPDIPAALPVALSTFVVTDYEALDLSGSCSGLNFLTDAIATGVSVVTMRRDSQLAQAWRTAFDEDARAVDRNAAPPSAGGLEPVQIQSQTITARVVPATAGQSSALLDIGDTTVMLTGPFLPSTLQPYVDLLKAQP